MSKISKVHARQIFDSRGNPTIEAEVILDNNIRSSSIVPSGASTGTFEAYELRDNNKNYLFELKDRRKFDYETLKYLNKEHYIKKINI